MQLTSIYSFGWSLSQCRCCGPSWGQFIGLSRRALATPGVLPRCCLCCPFTPHVLLSFFTPYSQRNNHLSYFFFFGLLFHIKWELCLFRLPLQLNTHVIQARDKMEELFFFQVHLASNLSNKLFYHIVLTLDRRAY